MKTTVYTQDLKVALNKLNKFADNKTKVLTTDNIKVTATENGVMLEVVHYNGYNAHVIATIENKNFESSGIETYNLKKLIAFVKKSKADTFTFTELCVSSGKTSLKQAKNCSNQFSNHDTVDNLIMKVSKEDYKTAINKTAYAISKTDSRPVLKCINHIINSNSVEFIGCDSHRLAKYELKTTAQQQTTKAIDGVFLEKMVSTFDKSETELIMLGNDKTTKYVFDNMEAYVTNIEGNYPDTSRLIPEYYSTRALSNATELMESIEMLEIIKEEKIYLDVTKNTIDLLVEDENEKIETSVNVSGFDGDIVETAFNVKFMKEALRAVDTDNIALQFIDTNRPFIITNDNYDMNEVHLILPIKRNFK